MANNILTPSMITAEAMRILENNLVFGKNVNREYDDRFAVTGAKIGDTLALRKPARFVGTSGAALSTEDFVESSVSLVLDTQFHVDTTFDTKSLTLSLDDFSSRVIKPAVAAVANKIDADGLLMAKNSTYNLVGTPGTTPATALVVLQAGQYLDQNATPRDGQRSCVINPAANATLINGLSGLFNNARRISEQYDEGAFVDMTNTLGFKIAMDQNVATHTVGPLGGTPAVNGASQGITTGWAATTSLITDGWTAAAAARLKKGDVFTIAGIYSVNPQSRASTGTLQQFVVQADVSSDASGNLTAVVSPALISGGQFQNITASPADGTLITVVGTASTAYPQNIAYHRDAFTLGMADLQDVSQYGAWGGRRNYKNLAMRIARQYLIATDTVPCRVEVLYGYIAMLPENSCRITG